MPHRPARAAALLSAIAGGASLVLSAPATAAAPPPIGEIRPYSVIGSGCADANTHSETSEHGHRLRWTFDAFHARNGSMEESMPDCTAWFRIGASKGWTYALRSARVGGIADVPANTNTQIQFAAYPQTPREVGKMTTAFSERYVGPLRSKVQFDKLAYVPCERANDGLMVTIRPIVDGESTDPNAYLAVRSLEVSTDDLVWKRCLQ